MSTRADLGHGDPEVGVVLETRPRDHHVEGLRFQARSSIRVGHAPGPRSGLSSMSIPIYRRIPAGRKGRRTSPVRTGSSSRPRAPCTELPGPRARSGSSRGRPGFFSQFVSCIVEAYDAVPARARADDVVRRFPSRRSRSRAPPAAWDSAWARECSPAMAISVGQRKPASRGLWSLRRQPV